MPHHAASVAAAVIDALCSDWCRAAGSQMSSSVGANQQLSLDQTTDTHLQRRRRVFSFTGIICRTAHINGGATSRPLCYHAGLQSAEPFVICSAAELTHAAVYNVLFISRNRRSKTSANEFVWCTACCTAKLWKIFQWLNDVQREFANIILLQLVYCCRLVLL